MNSPISQKFLKFDQFQCTSNYQIHCCSVYCILVIVFRLHTGNEMKHLFILWSDIQLLNKVFNIDMQQGFTESNKHGKSAILQ